MSVVVTISRPGESPLTRSEIEQALAASTSFVRGEDGGWRLVDTPVGAELFLNVEEAEAWTDGSRDWLEESSLHELRQLAAVLEARIFGEEDEDITDENPTSAEAADESISKPATIVATFFAVLLAPLLIVVAVLRLPWVLWRIARQK